jgi:hypothetical protein
MSVEAFPGLPRAVELSNDEPGTSTSEDTGGKMIRLSRGP